jgi:hypothetical protein
MALAQSKRARFEAALSRAFDQAYLFQFAAGLDRFNDAPDPGALFERDLMLQRIISGLGQPIAHVERSWHKALDTLRQLQDRRKKAEAAAANQPQTGQTLESRSKKNAKQSHRSGDPIPLKGGGIREVICIHPSGRLALRLDVLPGASEDAPAEFPGA